MHFSLEKYSELSKRPRLSIVSKFMEIYFDLDKTKLTSKQKRDKSPPENELKCRRLRAYDDAIAMLQSIRALPETNNIKLRLASRESPPK